ncbi:hypothetical protein PPN31114_04402 [Pandoraea pneumonica]|uniref:BIG2 domain-containing protein n=1 Tax=Pandoraea pneumonica TaxID=2508299 RepID=A0A5E4YB85_9BURK|nr:hypothetical protein [Pandoraea pneumonica]VVE45730.1 hypothetical protein PPN31114_04402 [Pandoraea pneumonica]
MNFRDPLAPQESIAQVPRDVRKSPYRDALPRNLLAPVVPLAVANGGIRYVDLIDPEGWIDVQIPWNIVFLKGDVFRLYWGIEGDVVDVIIGEDPNAPMRTIRAPVPKVIEAGEGEIEVWYERVSPFDEVPVPSPRTTVRVKITVPGGFDPDQTTPINENLAPAILPPGPIQKPIPAQGLPVTILAWENMAEGDRLILRWGSQSVPVPPLDASQVGQDLVVMVSEQVIDDAGDSENMPVSYDIRDIVNNWSKWAPNAYIEVDVGGSNYLAPDVIDLIDDTLDFDSLNGDVASAIVIRNGDMATGDSVELIFEGHAFGGHDVTYSDTKTLTGNSMLFQIPNDILGQSVPGQGSVFYRVTGAGGAAKGRSSRTSFTLTGTPVSLPAPHVREAVGGTLDPANVANGATVDIAAWSGMAAGDTVTMHWVGTSGGGAPVSYTDYRFLEAGDVGDTVTFLVPYNDVAAFAGGRADVYYTVQAGQGSRESQHLPLNVLAIVQLAPPFVQGEMGGELDPELVPDGATMTLPAWPEMAVGDSVTWFWLGTSAGGQATGTITVTEVGPVTVTVPRGVIEINANGGDTVSALYEITRVGGTSLTSLARVFKVLPLPALRFDPPIVEEANGDVLDPADVDVDATVSVLPYPGMTFGEVLTVRFGAGSGPGEHIATIPITASMVGRTVQMFVPKAKVEFFEGRTVTVNYTVTTANGETDSKDLVLNVRSHVLLPAPTVTEAEGDYLPDGAYPRGATTVVHQHPEMTAGDMIDLYWGDGAREYHDAIPIVVPMDFPFTVPKAVVDRWYGTVVPVRYTLTRGGTVMQSEVLHLRVALLLQAPVVLEAPDGVLDPADALDGVTVRVAYDGMTTGDEIEVFLDGVGGIGPHPGSADGQVDIPVPANRIAPYVGQTVPVHYTVTRNGVVSASGILSLVVGEFADEVLPTPEIPEAEDGMLKLSSFEGDPTVDVAPWPLIAVGQRVWLRCYGTLESDANDTIVLLQAHEVTALQAAQGLSEAIPRARLEALRNESNLVVELTVAFDGGTNEAQATLFPELRVTIEVLPELEVPSTEEMILNGLAVKQNWPRTGTEAPGNWETRAATGGVPPYTYTSGNAAIATVNASGTVIGQRNGRTTITIRDSAGSTTSYAVVVSNVFEFRWNDSIMSPQQAVAWKNTIPGAIGIDMTTMQLIWSLYTSGERPPGGYFHWACELSGCVAPRSLTFDTAYLSYGCHDPSTAFLTKAVCLVPKNG